MRGHDTPVAKGYGTIAGRLQGMSPLEALGMLGLDKRFVESELKLAESLAQGKAVEHHLEPSYFRAMQTALDATQGGGERA